MMGSAPRFQAVASQSQRKLSALELLERAHVRFAQGDYEGARTYYLQALPSFSSNFDVLKDLGYCYYVKGPSGYVEAAKYYERAYALNPRSGQVAEKLSQCYVALNMYQEAAAIEMRLAETPGSPPEVWKRAAEAYVEAGDDARATQAYIAYLQRKPGDVAARCALGRFYSLHKDYGNAAEQYRLVLFANPNYAAALVGLARILSWQGQLAPSLDLYDRALRFEPNNGEALSGKAFVLLWQKRDREALDLFETLDRRYPHDADIRRGLQEARTRIGARTFARAERNGAVSNLMANNRGRVAKNPHAQEAFRALTSSGAGTHPCNASIAYSRKALDLLKDNDDAKIALARSLRLCKDYTEAVVYYDKYLQSHPRAEGALYELGDTLRRARRFADALKAFQKLVQLDPHNLDGQVGLAQVLAATGEYDEALSRFDRVLAQKPDDYDAQQGKAYVLFWNNDFGPARALFRALAKRNPNDPQNPKELKDIAQAEAQAKWKAMRPSADAAPQRWIDFYRKRLSADPKDPEALKGLAYAKGENHERSAAIRDYRRALEIHPHDRDAKLDLAHLLGLDEQYPASLQLYREVLSEDPDDPQVLGSLARVYVWAHHPRQALGTYQRLLSQDAENPAYLLEAARLQFELKQYAQAHASLESLLSVDPENRDARLELARVDIARGQLENASKDYDLLLRDNPLDPDALLGKARTAFYQGKLQEAQATAAEALRERPKNFSSVYLLASIEHARHRRRKTLDLLSRADQLSPGNPEVALLRKRVLSEFAVTLTTTAAYAREIGPPSESGGRAGLANEDLRMYTYGTTIGLSLFPRTASYISYTALPTESPLSPERDSSGDQVPTGISGTVAPSEFLYRQSTRLGRGVTLRGGVGFVRFGPGGRVSVPGQGGTLTIRAADHNVIGQAALGLAPTKKLSLDFDAGRSAITSTSTSTRFGVVEDRLKGRINYFFNARTQFHAAYWNGRFSSKPYVHVLATNGPPQNVTQADHEDSNRVSVTFKRTIFQSNVFSFDAGYEGVAYGFGTQGNVYLGFFNPRFYQRHEFVPRIYGRLGGPFGYELSSGIGIQQLNHGGPVTRAWQATPDLSLRVNRHLTLIAGYTHYNTAQALGPLRGNAVWFTTRWRY